MPAARRSRPRRRMHASNGVGAAGPSTLSPCQNPPPPPLPYPQGSRRPSPPNPCGVRSTSPAQEILAESGSYTALTRRSAPDFAKRRPRLHRCLGRWARGPRAAASGGKPWNSAVRERARTQPAPRGAAARRARVPGAGRRAALPAGRRRDRRPARRRPARGPGRRQRGAAHLGEHLRLPRLRHHGRRGPPARCRLARRGDRRRHRRHLAGDRPRRRHGRARRPVRRTGRGALRRLQCGDRPGRDLPADLGSRHPRHARRPRHHRRAARPAGHPNPARRRRRRVHPQRRAQRLVRARAALGHRRLRVGHGHRPDPDGRRPRRGAGPVCRRHVGAAAGPPRAGARRRPRGRAAARAHPGPARRAPGDDLGGGRARRRAPGRLPGDRHDLDLPRLRPRRPGHRRAGDHRQGPGSRRGRPHPRRDHPRHALGSRRRHRARRAAAPAPPGARAAVQPRPRGAGGHRGRPGRRGPGPAALRLRLRRRRRAHRCRRRPVAGPGDARDPRGLPPRHPRRERRGRLAAGGRHHPRAR